MAKKTLVSQFREVLCILSMMTASALRHLERLCLHWAWASRRNPNPWITKSTSGGFFFSTSFRRVSTVFYVDTSAPPNSSFFRDR